MQKRNNRKIINVPISGALVIYSSEDGIIKNDIIDYTPEDMKIDKAKAELRDIISRLEVIRDEI